MADEEILDEEVDFFETDEYKEYFMEALTLQLEKAVELEVISDSQEYLDMVKNDEQVYNFAVMMMSVLACQAAVIMDDDQQTRNSFNVDLAVDDELDDLGAIIGVDRPEGSHAAVVLTFTIKEEEHDYIEYPAGIIVRTDNNVRYITVDTLTFRVEDTEASVTAVAVNNGAAENVKANTLTYIESDVETYNLTVTNPLPSSGGSAMMEDEEYREILKDNYLVHRRGCLSAYYEYFEDYDGLRSYKIYPCWNGEGTVKIIVDVAGVESTQIDDIKIDIEEDVKSAGETVTVYAANKQYITVNIIADVEIDTVLDISETEKENIKSKIIESTYIYVNGGITADEEIVEGLGIGEDFIPFQLGVFLDLEIDEIKNLNITYPNSVVEAEDDSVISIEKKEDINVVIN